MTYEYLSTAAVLRKGTIEFIAINDDILRILIVPRSLVRQTTGPIQNVCYRQNKFLCKMSLGRSSAMSRFAISVNRFTQSQVRI